MTEMMDSEIEGRAETRVWLTTSDVLYTRADLLVRQDDRLGAVVDGILLDLGPLNEQLLAAMAFTNSVHMRADHYLGGLVERQIPLVHQ
jgi:hypothetical protein